MVGRLYAQSVPLSPMVGEAVCAECPSPTVVGRLSALHVLHTPTVVGRLSALHVHPSHGSREAVCAEGYLSPMVGRLSAQRFNSLLLSWEACLRRGIPLLSWRACLRRGIPLMVHREACTGVSLSWYTGRHIQDVYLLLGSQGGIYQGYYLSS